MAEAAIEKPRTFTEPKREAFNPREVSPSRVEQLNQCGVAFRLKYLEGVPEEVSGSAALRGSVIHEALEKWAVNREQSLVQLVRQAWLSVTQGTAVADFIGEYQAISVEVIKAEHAAAQAFLARQKRETKAPRMTKEFKESDACKKLNRLLAQWIPKLNAGSPWRFTERDPLPSLYDDSLVVAKRYQHRYGHLPPALHTELGFREEWRGFVLKGFIDSIEMLVSPDGEIQGVGILDYKTYGKPPAEHKDYRQVVMYDAAVRSLIERGALPALPDGVPLLIGVDYVRWSESWKDTDGQPFPPRRFWEVGPADHDRLERELTAFTATVEARHFLPAEKGRNVDFCGFPSQCCLNSTAAAGGEARRVEVIL